MKVAQLISIKELVAQLHCTPIWASPDLPLLAQIYPPPFKVGDHYCFIFYSKFPYYQQLRSIVGNSVYELKPKYIVVTRTIRVIKHVLFHGVYHVYLYNIYKDILNLSKNRLFYLNVISHISIITRRISAVCRIS